MPSRSTTATSTSLLTLAEAAGYLGVSVRTLRRRVADGSLPAYRVGPLIRVAAGDIGALLRPIPAARTRAAAQGEDARRLAQLDGQAVQVRTVELAEGADGEPTGVGIQELGAATFVVPRAMRSRFGLPEDERGEEG